MRCVYEADLSTRTGKECRRAVVGPWREWSYDAGDEHVAENPTALTGLLSHRSECLQLFDRSLPGTQQLGCGAKDADWSAVSFDGRHGALRWCDRRWRLPRFRRTHGHPAYGGLRVNATRRTFSRSGDDVLPSAVVASRSDGNTHHQRCRREPDGGGGLLAALTVDCLLYSHGPIVTRAVKLTAERLDGVNRGTDGWMRGEIREAELEDHVRRADEIGE